MSTSQSRTRRLCAAWMLCGSALMACAPALAQTAPSSFEIARYGGLHAAAHKAQAGEIERLVATGATKKPSMP